MKIFVDKNSFLARAALVCLLLSLFFRATGALRLLALPKGEGSAFLTELALPAACCLLLAACIWLLGKRGFWLSVLPVILGTVFFMLRTYTGQGSGAAQLKLVLKILYLSFQLLCLLIYACTIFGAIKSKWFCFGLFASGLAFRLTRDYFALSSGEESSIFAVISEISLLFMLAGMCFLVLAFRKHNRIIPGEGRTVIPPIPGGRPVHSEAPEAPDEAPPEIIAAEIPVPETTEDEKEN